MDQPAAITRFPSRGLACPRGSVNAVVSGLACAVRWAFEPSGAPGLARVRNSAACLLVAALAAPAAYAARPFVTDDARLTTAGSCQVESWSRIYPSSTELWALPACIPGGNFEVTAGGGLARPDAASSSSDYIVQAKTLFRSLTPGGWGLGMALGRVVHPEVNPGPNLLGNTYVYFPLSLSLLDDRLVTHVNLGWLKDRATREDRGTWGIGAELRLDERWLGIAEVFGDSHNKPYTQIGTRFSILSDLQIDATLGTQFGASSVNRWLSLGLRYVPDKLW